MIPITALAALLPTAQVRWVIAAALFAAALAFAWFQGYSTGRDKLDDYIGQQAVAAVAIVTRQGKVTERVITEYVTVTVPRTELVTQTVEKEVIRYAEANPTGLCLDPDWRRLHDAAAANAVSDGSGRAPGGVRAPAAPAVDPGIPDRRPIPSNGDGQLRTASSLR